ncbi:MAG: hypothetical protein LV477_09035 [Candidatus Nitrosotalea sp.]|nr:hypothetical protein [Candidatus Nitrosotalea sp.]
MMVLSIITAISTAIIAGTAVLTAFYIKKDRCPKFLFNTYEVNGIWKIRLQQPERMIQSCSVYFDGTKLRVANTTERYEIQIGAGGGATFEIPENIMNENGKVIIKHDNCVKKIKFSEFPKVEP